MHGTLNVKSRGPGQLHCSNAKKTKVSPKNKHTRWPRTYKKRDTSFLDPEPYFRTKQNQQWNVLTLSIFIFNIDNLYIHNFMGPGWKREWTYVHLPCAFSDQLDRWSRISLVKKALIHYQRVPWTGCCGVQECPRMWYLKNVFMSETWVHVGEEGREQTFPCDPNSNH